MVAVYHNYVIFQDVTPFEVSVHHREAIRGFKDRVVLVAPAAQLNLAAVGLREGEYLA